MQRLANLLEEFPRKAGEHVTPSRPSYLRARLQRRAANKATRVLGTTCIVPISLTDTCVRLRAELELEDAREVVQSVADEYKACESPDYVERSTEAVGRSGLL